jgi:hypothetical protein
LEKLFCARTARVRAIASTSGKLFWSWRRDLNPRPSDYKSDALPAELRQQNFLQGADPSGTVIPCSLSDCWDNLLRYHNGYLRAIKAVRLSGSLLTSSQIRCYDDHPDLPFMRIKRPLPLILIVLLTAGAIIFVVQLRKYAPPEPARLLPGAEGFFYVNLRWMRALNATDQLPPVSHEPEYEQFISETGFQFERDLNEAAVAVHYPGHPGNSAKEARYSEVFVGKIETDRMTAYLRKLSTKVDKYGDNDIYDIPLEGRTLRVSLLSVDTVAASNLDDPAVIRGMIDRSHKLASPFAGPWFMRRYYKTIPINYEIPFTTLAWGIARVEPSTRVSSSVLGNMSLLFSKPAVVVASARYIRALNLRAEAFAASPDDARDVTEKIGAFLNLFHTAESSVTVHGTDVDVNAFLQSLKVEQHESSSVLTATVPTGFLHKIFELPPATEPVPSPTPQERPSKPRKPSKAQK